MERFDYNGDLSHAAQLLSNIKDGPEYLNRFLELAKEHFPADDVIFYGNARSPVKFTQMMDGKSNEYFFYPSVGIWVHDNDISLTLKNRPGLDSNKTNLERLARSMISGELKDFSAGVASVSIKNAATCFNPLDGLKLYDNIVIAEQRPSYACSDIKRKHAPALTYRANTGKNGVVYSNVFIYDVDTKGKSRNFADILSQQMPELNVCFGVFRKDPRGEWETIRKGTDWNSGNPRLVK